MSLSTSLIHQIIIIPKTINLLTFLLISIKLIKKYKQIAIEQRYVLNRVFITGFLAWILYILLDMILYPLASLSFMNQGIEQMNLLVYYPEQYPSLLYANILRDIALGAAFIMAYAYLFGALILRKGELWVEEKVLKKTWLLILILFLTLFLIANDTIGVKVVDGDIIVEAVWNGAAGISILLTIIIYALSSLVMASVILKIEYNERDLKREFSKIAIGMMMMGLGSIYWFIFGYIREVLHFSQIIVLIGYFVGHLIWMSSPILIYRGLSKMWKRKHTQLIPSVGEEPK